MTTREGHEGDGSAVSEWQKGGLRYAKLKKIVPEYFPDSEVRGFFIGVRAHGGFTRIFNPLSPLQREFVVVALGDGVAILRLRRPGVFRASIAGVVHRGPVDNADVSWRDGCLFVNGTVYEPIAFHHEDAERVAQLLKQLAPG